MREEARNHINVRLANVQSYHAGGRVRIGDAVMATPSASIVSAGEVYAFRGFTGNWYFNSDRKIKLDENFRRADGQPLQGYGLEIETECRGIHNISVYAEVLEKIIFPNFKFGADMFKMQHDGSLGGDVSAEIITQIMTKGRIRNDYAAYEAMYDKYFPAFGIKADTMETSCGMHVNVSVGVFGKTPEQQAEAVKKLYYVVNRHYDVFVKAFYRNPRRTHWCARQDYNRAKRLDLFSQPNDHGLCLNLSHYRAGRVEIRLVGGQKEYKTFRNTMETVFFLCEHIGRLPWSALDDLSKVFKGCNQYVYKRLATECSGLIPADVLLSIERNVKRENLQLRGE